MRPSCAVLALALYGLVSAAPAHAGANAPSAAELAEVGAALERGAFSEAIDRLELWSDQGVVHPDLSFDRGVAYLGRAESNAARPGDLGQAAAAFQEARELRGDDDEAAVILERIRARISELRGKGDAGVIARPRLLRALLGLIGENVWAVIAALGSLGLTLGLAVRFAVRARQLRLGANIAAALGLCLLALGAGMAAAGRSLRTHYSPAVVIVEAARVVDASGRPAVGSRGPSSRGAAGDRIPEGSLVHVAESRGGLVKVEWGDAEVWLNAQQLRRLASR